MRVRIKFTKTGVMKFIGHLDMMRFFQKALRRAKIDVAFSEGFSPHMIMSFASPLGVGVTSSAEYFDLDLKSALAGNEMLNRLNAQMVDGVTVVSIGQIKEDKASKGMTLVSACDYSVTLREGAITLPEDMDDKIAAFLSKESIPMWRKTKRSEAIVDIKPWIYSFSYDGQAFHMQISSGSVSNLKPDLLMQAFFAFLGIEMPKFALLIHRDEIYANIGTDEERKLVPLEALTKPL